MPLYHLHACHRKSWRLCGMRQWPCGPAQARKSPAMLSKPAMQHSARRHPAAAIITKTIRRRAYFQLSDTCRYFWKRRNHRHRQSVQRLFRHLESGGHSGRGYSPFIQCSRRSFPEIGSAASFANHPYRYVVCRLRRSLTICFARIFRPNATWLIPSYSNSIKQQWSNVRLLQRFMPYGIIELFDNRRSQMNYWRQIF